jgi:MYXO-CTERM domain-containing protein
MVRMLLSVPALALAQLCAVQAQAEECAESSDCPAGKVCQHNECIDVVPECAEFCEALSPCFSSATECEGGGVLEIAADGGEVVAFEIVEEWEDCHAAGDHAAKLLDDCLGDCSGAKADAASWEKISALMECMKKADYSCDAEEICAEGADFEGSGGAGYDPDAYSTGDGEGKTAGLTEEVQSGADKSGNTGSGGGGKSCSTSASASSRGSGVWVLLGLAMAVLVAWRRGITRTGAPSGRSK